VTPARRQAFAEAIEGALTAWIALRAHPRLAPYESLPDLEAIPCGLCGTSTTGYAHAHWLKDDPWLCERCARGELAPAEFAKYMDETGGHP
jgi:hypothetical protein